MKTTITAILFIMISSVCYSSEFEMKCELIESEYNCGHKMKRKCTKQVVRCENKEVLCYGSTSYGRPMQCKFKAINDTHKQR